MPTALTAEELQEMDNEDRVLYVRVCEKGDEAERARFVIYARARLRTDHRSDQERRHILKRYRASLKKMVLPTTSSHRCPACLNNIVLSDASKVFVLDCMHLSCMDCAICALDHGVVSCAICRIGRISGKQRRGRNVPLEHGIGIADEEVRERAHLAHIRGAAESGRERLLEAVRSASPPPSAPPGDAASWREQATRAVELAHKRERAAERGADTRRTRVAASSAAALASNEADARAAAQLAEAAVGRERWARRRILDTYVAEVHALCNAGKAAPSRRIRVAELNGAMMRLAASTVESRALSMVVRVYGAHGEHAVREMLVRHGAADE